MVWGGHIADEGASMTATFRCVTCGSIASKGYEGLGGDTLELPWYTDETRQGHVAIVCLHCGTIHDCSGSSLQGLRAIFKSQVKVYRAIRPSELSVMVMGRTVDPSVSRQVAIRDFQIPERVIDLLVERNLLGPIFGRPVIVPGGVARAPYR